MYRNLFLVIAFLLVAFSLMAQAPFPTPTPTAVYGAPIDGGLSLLLAAGAAYGAKKIYDHKRKEREE